MRLVKIHIWTKISSGTVDQIVTFQLNILGDIITWVWISIDTFEFIKLIIIINQIIGLGMSQCLPLYLLTSDLQNAL